MGHSSKWYWLAVVYFLGMALTGVCIRYRMPENSANQEHYLGYMFVLTMFWPVTVMASLTNEESF